MTPDLFGDVSPQAGTMQAIGARAFILHGAALADADRLLAALDDIERTAPFRCMATPGGRLMSVALTNCGAWGWVSDQRGYRYARRDPLTDAAWPPMPAVLSDLAARCAAAVGFPGFAPDACLVNRYLPGTRLSLHQDKNERDFDAPIVSISLGIPAVFLFGGHARGDRAARHPLFHGDVAIWGGPDRLRYHGILPLAAACHPRLGARRINFTLRKAG